MPLAWKIFSSTTCDFSLIPSYDVSEKLLLLHICEVAQELTFQVVLFVLPVMISGFVGCSLILSRAFLLLSNVLGKVFE